MKLGDFLDKHWAGMLACAVLHRVSKMARGWVVRTSCGVTAATMQQALSLPALKTSRNSAALRAALITFEKHVHTKRKRYLLIEFNLKGSHSPDDNKIHHTNLGHRSIIVVKDGLVTVVQSYIAHDRVDVHIGKTMSQCRPQRHRDPAEIAQALEEFIYVYGNATFGALLDPALWARYRRAVELILGQNIPNSVMRRGTLTPYAIESHVITATQMIQKLRQFAAVQIENPVADTHEWIRAERSSPPVTSHAFLTLIYGADWRRHIRSLRRSLKRLDKLTL